MLFRSVTLALAITATIFCTTPHLAYGDYGSSSPSGSSSPPSASKPLPAFPTNPSESGAKEGAKLPPLKPKHLPTMLRPFGMPGVIGVVNEGWQNSDYLGYLAHNIPVTVEVLKGKNVPNVDTTAIEKALTAELQKENILNSPQAKEGPILPFLHLLIIIYAPDENRFVVLGNLRLFEEIVVVRKRFSPAGFWQGITWENQDVTLTNNTQLQQSLNAMASKLGSLFAARYHEYNKDLDKEPQENTGESTGEPAF